MKDAEHGEGVSSVQCEDGTAVRSSIVLDATGHTRKLIHFGKGKKFDPGFQGAYGITAKVGLLIMILCREFDMHGAHSSSNSIHGGGTAGWCGVAYLLTGLVLESLPF